MSIESPTAPITVVLVDDHVVFIQSLARLLADFPGIEVVALTADAAGARSAVERLAPDLVLLDHALPDSRGTDLAAEIVSTYPATRVVMLTATEEDDTLLAAIEAGCSGYVTKVQPIEEVVAAVRAAYAGEVVMAPAMLARLLPRLTRQEAPAHQRTVSERELEVLRLMAEGHSNGAIADRLFLSTNTVRNHVQHIFTKLGAHSKLEAVAIAVREGLIRYS